ncbi:MAG TPA: ATP-binding protein [bacterium]|nr:ATP-binding protein [bacterium]HPJ71860.1 ATP-binding protein [bacterium]HPQ65545.1 ATP-binding protein [bacterium]
MKKEFIDRFIERLDRIGPQELEEYLLAFKARKGFLEGILNGMQEGVVAFNAGGRIVLVNRAAEGMLNLPEEPLGLGYEEAVPLGAVRDIVRQGLRLPGQALTRDIFIAGTSPRWVRLSRSGLFDGNGSFGGIVLVLSDVTRLRRAESEASKAATVDYLSFLTAAVAHELGNPLGSLSLHAQLLERRLRELPARYGLPLRKSAEVIREEIERLNGIVRQFLQALRPAPVSLREHDPSEVIGEVETLLEPELKERRVDLILKPPSRPFRCRFDRDQLKQALINLVRNAAQAIARSGSIEISWAQDGGYFQLTVADDGGGISSRDLGRIAEPFFTTREGGAGLGFLVVYRIVRQHGGTVEVSSEEGVGTAVKVRLPLRPDTLKALPKPREEEDSPKSSP